MTPTQQKLLSVMEHRNWHGGKITSPTRAKANLKSGKMSTDRCNAILIKLGFTKTVNEKWEILK